MSADLFITIIIFLLLLNKLLFFPCIRANNSVYLDTVRLFKIDQKLNYYHKCIEIKPMIHLDLIS